MNNSNSYGFIKLCYGVVGSYKDTSKITTQQVVEEFLKHEGVSSAEEYYDKSENNTYGKLKQEYLTKSNNNAIMSDGNNTSVYTITDSAINNVPLIKIDGFTDAQNQFIQNQHKELLRYARDNYRNKEVAFSFRKDLTDKQVHHSLENEDVIKFGISLLLRGNNIFVMHTHPNNRGFSDVDILNFITNDAIGHMSIVKNNGKVEIISKTSKFNINRAEIEFKRHFKKYVKTGADSEIDCAIKLFLERMREDIIWKINK